MVKIRLSRRGIKKRAFYKIVVTDHRKPRDSGFIETLGFYNPFSAEHEESFRIDKDKLAHWQKHGAQLSLKVTQLLKKQAS